MDELKIKHLQAKKSTTCIDEFEISRRIHAEHLFLSIQEALDYMESIIKDKPINPDDPFFISYKNDYVFVTNIFDEAVCSIIYELYFSDLRNNQDLKGYYSIKLSEFNDMLRNLSSEYSKKYPFINSLYNLMDSIYYLSFPVEHKEEVTFGEVAEKYYILMATMYQNFKPFDEYANKYYNYYINKILTKRGISNVI